MPQVELARDLVRSALARGRRRAHHRRAAQQLLSTLGVRDRPAMAGTRVRGTELSVAVARDPVFGPVIRFGSGKCGRSGGRPGRRAAAAQHRHHPDAHAHEPDSAGLFTAAGGMSRAGALGLRADAVGGLGAGERGAQLVALAICPLVAAGDEVYAARARRPRLRRSPPPAWSATGTWRSPSTPSALRARWTARRGPTGVTVRPIRPEDALKEASFVRNLSDNARHFRFMVGLRELPREMLIRFTQIDYDRERLALVALCGEGGRGGLHRRWRATRRRTPRVANVAIVVADAWQGRGDWPAAVRAADRAARARAFSSSWRARFSPRTPQVRSLLARLGFEFRRDPDGGDVFSIDKTL